MWQLYLSLVTALLHELCDFIDCVSVAATIMAEVGLFEADVADEELSNEQRMESEVKSKLSLDEFDVRRKMVAAEMEARLAAMRVHQDVPDPGLQASSIPAAPIADEVVEDNDVPCVLHQAATSSSALAPLATSSRPMPPGRRPRSCRSRSQRDESIAHLESSRDRMKESAPSFLSELAGRLTQNASDDISDSDEIEE